MAISFPSFQALVLVLIALLSWLEDWVTETLAPVCCCPALLSSSLVCITFTSSSRSPPSNTLETWAGSCTAMLVMLPWFPFSPLSLLSSSSVAFSPAQSPLGELL